MIWTLRPAVDGNRASGVERENRSRFGGRVRTLKGMFLAAGTSQLADLGPLSSVSAVLPLDGGVRG